MLTGIIPGRVKFLDGDATLPMAGGHRVLINLVNVNGEWSGDDFSQKLSKRWPIVQSEYRRSYLGQRDFKLGNIQEIRVRSDFSVLNLICIDESGNLVDLDECLEKAAVIIKDVGSSVHIPLDYRWEEIGGEDAVDLLVKKGINVTFYNC